jgi:hypothetical protein
VRLFSNFAENAVQFLDLYQRERRHCQHVCNRSPQAGFEDAQFLGWTCLGGLERGGGLGKVLHRCLELGFVV